MYGETKDGQVDRPPTSCVAGGSTVASGVGVRSVRVSSTVATVVRVECARLIIVGTIIFFS